MFSSKKTVIFITKSKVKITRVDLGKPKETIIGEFDWTQESLSNSLSKFTKIIGNSARLVLSEDFVYVIFLSFPNDAVLNKDIIRQKAQELIPENLNETVWDYKEIPSVSSSYPKKIQVAASVKKLFENLSLSFFKSSLHVQQIEPLSFSLARFAKNQEEIILFIYIYDKVFLTLVQNGVIQATERIELPLNRDKVNKFIAFTKQQMKVIPERIIFCGNTGDINLKEYEDKNFKTEIQDLSPTISLAYKKPIENNNGKELNIELVKNFGLNENNSDKTHKLSNNSRKFPNLFIVGIVLGLLVIILEVFLYLRQ